MRLGNAWSLQSGEKQVRLSDLFLSHTTQIQNLSGAFKFNTTHGKRTIATRNHLMNFTAASSPDVNSQAELVPSPQALARDGTLQLKN